MSCKYVDPVRWQQPLFSNLSPRSKLLLCYLYDNCDLAGFLPNNKKQISFFLGIPVEEINSLFLEIENLAIIDGDIIWLKNHLVENRNFPLNAKNKAHQSIIRSFERNKIHTEAYSYFTSLSIPDTTLQDKDTTLHYRAPSKDHPRTIQGPSENDKIGLRAGELMKMLNKNIDQKNLSD